LNLKLIVGLGNPGVKYSATRHNIGRRCVECLSEKFSLRYSHLKLCQASSAELVYEGIKTVLAYPENYMNVSGESVERLCCHYDVRFQQDLLVLVDDVAIPFGSLRMRSKGSDGGHNGLKSIQMSLGSSDYSRLRLGIGSIPTGIVGGNEGQMGLSLEEFVLAPFTRDEEKKIDSLMDFGVNACLLWIKQPIEKVMNIVNYCGE
jgi:PTH1 family peptidyl-tRNA hydrolase